MTTTTPDPTGQIVKGPDGFDLVVTRTLPGSIDDAWASITEPDRTARWFGRWEGTGGPGETIKVQLGFEDGSPWSDVRIIECDAPHRLRVQLLSDPAPWEVSVELAGEGDRARLRFVQHSVEPTEMPEVGPGWEHYLDQLIAVMSDAPLPSFDDYYPALQGYYQQQVQ